MVTVLMQYRVADYDRFKLEYDRVLAGPLGGNVDSYRIWRGLDDPGLITVAETYESREVAEATFNDPSGADVCSTAGIDMSTYRMDYMDEVASRTH